MSLLYQMSHQSFPESCKDTATFFFSSLVTDCVMDVILNIVVLHFVFMQSSLCTKTV